MAYRTAEEFEQILRETPLAVRYLDLLWSIAKTREDWMQIKYRMAGAAMAVPPYSVEYDQYWLLSRIANRHMLDAIRPVGAAPIAIFEETA